MDELTRLHREFLKNTIRLRFDFSTTGQSRGLPPPPGAGREEGGRLAATMSQFKDFIGAVSYAIEAAGVFVIVAGFVLATIRAIRWMRVTYSGSAYRDYRRDIARSIILGLEFLIAGDIFRTVTEGGKGRHG